MEFELSNYSRFVCVCALLQNFFIENGPTYEPTCDPDSAAASEWRCTEEEFRRWWQDSQGLQSAVGDGAFTDLSSSSHRDALASQLSDIGLTQRRLH